jgi:selenide,water dikinase
MASMARLNRDAADAALRHHVRAATDITGFGLAGHASGVARESSLTLEIRAADLPLLPRAAELAPRFQPAGLKANRRQFEPGVVYEADPGEVVKALLYDPQTSGGLFLLVPETEAASLVAQLPGAVIIGRAGPASGPRMIIV